MQRIAIWTAAAVLAATPAAAQTTTAWHLLSGIEQFEFRDVVRAGPPVDGSPIGWYGTGPSFAVARERVSRARTHRIDAAVATFGRFEYRSPLRDVAAPSSDAAFRLDGRYEYHRRMLSRRLPRFAEAAVGLRASGEHLTLTHSVRPAADIGYAIDAGGIALILTGTVFRERRVSADVKYGNGLLIGWLRPRSGTTGASGGGWTTELDAGFLVRTTRKVSLVARYATRGETFLSSHRGLTTASPRLSVGVRYDR